MRLGVLITKSNSNLYKCYSSSQPLYVLSCNAIPAVLWGEALEITLERKKEGGGGGGMSMEE